MDDIVPARRAALRHGADGAVSRAASIRLLYAADWQRFTWCAARGEGPLAAALGAVALFCAGEVEAGRAPATITRRLAAIGLAHKLAGYKPQRADGGRAVAKVMAGIRRSWAAPLAREAAADADTGCGPPVPYSANRLRSLRSCWRCLARRW